MTSPPATDIPDLPDWVQAGPLALCSLQDIAGTLGMQDSSFLTPQQLARIPYLLAKLCSLFRTVAGREFTPGTTTVDMMSLRGRIPLPDPLGENGSVNEVVTFHGKVVAPENYSVRNDNLWIEETSLVGKERPGSGTVYTVTYTHNGEVPWDVRAAMAGLVGRYLTIDPTTAVAQSTFLSSGEFHQRIAAWVADVVQLTPGDIALAKSHRAIPVNVIVHKLDSYAQGRTDWSGWMWGGATLW